LISYFIFIGSLSRSQPSSSIILSASLIRYTWAAAALPLCIRDTGIVSNGPY
jgi:hypothetical protein